VTDKEGVLRIHLTPFIPLSLKGEGGDFYKEGLTPLLNTLIRQKISPLEGLPLSSPPCGYLVKGLKGTQVPLRNYLPLPLIKGKGIKGIGLINDLIYGIISL